MKETRAFPVAVTHINHESDQDGSVTVTQFLDEDSGRHWVQRLDTWLPLNVGHANEVLQQPCAKKS